VVICKTCRLFAVFLPGNRFYLKTNWKPNNLNLQHTVLQSAALARFAAESLVTFCKQENHSKVSKRRFVVEKNVMRSWKWVDNVCVITFLSKPRFLKLHQSKVLTQWWAATTDNESLFPVNLFFEAAEFELLLSIIAQLSRRIIPNGIVAQVKDNYTCSAVS